MNVLSTLRSLVILDCPAKVSLAWLVGIWILLTGISGCQPATPAPSRVQVNSSDSNSGSDILTPAIDYLFRFDEFEPTQARPQIAYQLNRWAEQQPAPAEQPPDPLLTMLPKDVRDLPHLTNLLQFQFNLEDVEYLQEAVWLRSIADWAGKRPSSQRLTAWLQKLEEQGGAAPAQSLAITERLFDWVIRNIQLDPLLDYPNVTTAGPDTQAVGTGPTPGSSPPRLGIAGPGYKHLPWQGLLYGHGDAWERARLFILLARQQGIEAVMLAVEEEFSPRPRPWVVAVLLGQELYLFDCRLGLPIAGPGGQGIATLNNLREDPELLRAMDLDGDRPYPMQAEELKRLVVLLEAAPQALAPRMKAVEAGLSGDQQLVLTTTPSALADRLKPVKGLIGFRLWPIAYEAILFREGIRRRAQQDPASAREYYQEVQFFERLNPLLQARHQHFRARFDSEDGRPGAKANYLAARTTKSALTSLTSDRDLQKSLGLVRQPDEKEEMFAARLAAMQAVMTVAKQNASYWLGLVQYETGNYQAAVDWFRDRTVESAPESYWIPGARYNLARSFEALGQLEQAREILFVDESPQQHGNILRARGLVNTP